MYYLLINTLPPVDDGLLIDTTKERIEWSGREYTKVFVMYDVGVDNADRQGVLEDLFTWIETFSKCPLSWIDINDATKIMIKKNRGRDEIILDVIAGNSWQLSGAKWLEKINFNSRKKLHRFKRFFPPLQGDVMIDIRGAEINLHPLSTKRKK